MVLLEKVNSFIRDYDGFKYLLLFNLAIYDAIYDRIRYLIKFESSIKYVISYNIGKIKIDSYGDLSLEETLALHNVITLMKSVFDKDRNDYTITYF